MNGLQKGLKGKLARWNFDSLSFPNANGGGESYDRGPPQIFHGALTYFRIGPY